MFMHERLGVVTSHTREEFERLKKGEGFSVVSWAVALKLATHLKNGKTYQTFPNQKVSRKVAAFVLAHFHGATLPGDLSLNKRCPCCGDEITPGEETVTRDDGAHPYCGPYRVHAGCDQ